MKCFNKTLLLIILTCSPFILAQNIPNTNIVNSINSDNIPQALRKTVTLNLNDVTFADALKKISEICGISINYNYNLIPVDDIVNVKADNELILKPLLKLLSSTGTQLRIISEREIVIIKQDKSKPANSISGKIHDESTRSPLIGANIVLRGTDIGVTSNRDGEFIFGDLADGFYDIEISYIGYESEIVKDVCLFNNSTKSLEVVLKEKSYMLNEVTVTPGMFSIMGPSPVMEQTLTKSEISNTTFAEDIYRSIRRLPGVSSNDFSAKFSVRGGENEEVMVLLDGMQLHEPFHMKDFMGGVLSVIDVYTIGGINLYTGSYPAEYGNKMSGVFDIRTQSVENFENSFSAGISLMNARLLSKGTFADNKGSWLLSARRGYLDIVLSMIEEDDEYPSPKYYDILGKINYKLDDVHTLGLSYLMAKDDMSYTENDLDVSSTEYGNKYLWLTLNSVLGKNLLVRSLVGGGMLDHQRSGTGYFDDSGIDQEFDMTDKRKFQYLNIKQDWSYEYSDYWHLKWGFDFNFESASYNYKSLWNRFIYDPDKNENNLYVEEQDININPTGNLLGGYFSHKLKLTEPMTAEVGVRYDYDSATDDHLFSPRVNFAYTLSSRSFLRAGWGKFYQPQKLNEIIVQFGENDLNPPQLSEHYTLGFEHHFQNGMQLRLEAYYKNITNIRPLYREIIPDDNIELFTQFIDNNIKFYINDAISKGIEVFFKYDVERQISWYASYILSYKDEKIIRGEKDGITYPANKYYPSSNHQKHSINFDINYRPADDWHISFSWRFHSGWPRNEYYYTSGTDSEGNIIFNQQLYEYNSLRFPDYHRFDIRVNKIFTTSLGKFTLFLELINIFDNDNVKGYAFNIIQVPNSTHLTIEKIAANWLPRLPSLGFSWEINY